jgi:mevalonate kinase
MFQASAPGKIILFGEHAVVYGRPAIAAPLHRLQATAQVMAGRPGQGVVLELPDIGQRATLADAASQPLAQVALLTLAALGLHQQPDWTVSLRSTIPLASGLGSGAAAAAAIVAALAGAAGVAFAPAQVSALVYESETRFHGTPSGVDNTVIAYRQPVWFVRGQPPRPFALHRPLTLVVADTGIASPTSLAVARYTSWIACSSPTPVLHRALEGLAAGDQAHAAGALVDDGGADRLRRSLAPCSRRRS